MEKKSAIAVFLYNSHGQQGMWPSHLKTDYHSRWGEDQVLTNITNLSKQTTMQQTESNHSPHSKIALGLAAGRRCCGTAPVAWAAKNESGSKCISEHDTKQYVTSTLPA